MEFQEEIFAMRVALLTGGGDCPGLNAVIYAAVRKGINHYGDEFIGFLNGWRGVLDNSFIPLTLDKIDGIQLKGGTILHSSRTNVKKIPGGIEKVQEVLKINKIDALIALGGDDTQSVTLYLSENGVPSVGVPKTIDNDISGTDATFGFDTAVMIATEAIDRIHTTADSHNRVIVIEVMGRDAGWIACASGVAGGAHVILVPEREIDIDHVCKLLKYNYDHGKHYGVVVVAEGCHLPEVGQVVGSQQVDSFGHARLSGIGEALAELIEKKTGYETRSVNLGLRPYARAALWAARHRHGAPEQVGPHRGSARNRHHRHHHQGSHCHQPPARSAVLRCDRRPGVQGLSKAVSTHHKSHPRRGDGFLHPPSIENELGISPLQVAGLRAALCCRSGLF
jgi:6-phosphofructokinase 1